MNLGKAQRNELDEIVVALFVLGQKYQVITPLVLLALDEAVFDDIGFATQNRLHARLDGRVVELLGSVHVAVVGYRHGSHRELLGTLYERWDRSGTVQYRILRMYVKMNELWHISK